MLLFIWVFFSLSIIVGIFNIKSIISVIAPLESTDIEPKMNEDIYSLASSQEALFFVGLLVFVLLGVFAFSARQRTATTPDEAKKSWRCAGRDLILSFVTTIQVKASHPKAMPVILTTQDETEGWSNGAGSIVYSDTCFDSCFCVIPAEAGGVFNRNNDCNRSSGTARKASPARLPAIELQLERRRVDRDLPSTLSFSSVVTVMGLPTVYQAVFLSA